MTRARLKGFTKSIPNGISYLLRTSKDRSFSSRKFFKIVFKDVTFQQYDFEGEINSLREGMTLLFQEYFDLAIPSIDEFLETTNLTHEPHSNWEALSWLFNKYGSDKSTKNNLHTVYGPIIESFKDKATVTILEIGLGTNNVDVPSNMGTLGRPGASLYAFSEYLGDRGTIFGADVDKEVLFNTGNIRTFYVNQLDMNSIIELGKVSQGFDLIIDDGLHTFEANIKSLIALLPKLNKQGVLVIEDISLLPEHLVLWSALSEKLSSKGFKSSLIKSSTSTVFVAIRN
jgi:hypothetical protein